MILQCPQCNARFMVPDAQIPADGRTVKCGRCANMWHVHSPNPVPIEGFEAAVEETVAPTMPADAPPADEAVTPPEQMQLPAVRKRKFPVRPFKIAVPVLALTWAVLAIFAYFPTAQYKPVLKNIYGMLGVTDTRGLVFDALTMERQDDDTKTRFMLSGSIANHAATERVLPSVRVELKDQQGKVVWSRGYEVNLTLKAGQVYPFRIDNVETSFANRVATIVLDIGNSFELMVR